MPSTLPVSRVLNVFIDILTCTTSGTFQMIKTNPTFVRSAVIQNLTTTAGTQITITSDYGSSKGINGAQKKGYLLAAGTGNNIPGGNVTLPAHEHDPLLIDLSKLFWTASTTNGQIAVEYEIDSGGIS